MAAKNPPAPPPIIMTLLFFIYFSVSFLILLQKSIKYLKRLIQINPDNFHAYANLGQALNKQGIVLLQTESSFTANPQVLIDELKFIIDRDNLKAN